MIIESTKNELIKKARALSTKKGRMEQGLHFIEGENLVREAVVSGAEFSDAFIEDGHELMAAVLSGSGASVHLVKRNVMKNLTNTETPQWVCATIKTPETSVPNVYPAGLIVALDRVQEPGNLGAIIRTADAMGASGILIGEGCADQFAPKPVRASMGSIYHIPIWRGDLFEELKRLSDTHVLICAHLKGSSGLPDPTKSCVLVIGNESAGVSDDIANMCSLYKLPMYGFAESLNASVAAGIIIYEIAKKMNGEHAIFK